MTTDQYTLRNPVDAYPRPDFQAPPQNSPGASDAMSPQPDHGEGTYRGSGRLTGRKAIVTGADSGIGRAVAIAFAREGDDVIVSYLNEEAEARDTVRLVEEAGRKGIAAPGDIAQESHCKALIERTQDELGGIDILVNNAAFQSTHARIEDFTTAELERTFRTNVYAMFWLCRAAIARMKPGSSIVNTTSIQAYQPEPLLLAYAATKAAIVNFTKGFALEAIGRGVRVNAVAPGPVWTPLIPATMPQDEVPRFGAASPMGRPAQPAELAPAYVFLASGESSYINGAILAVTGGMPLT